MYVGKVYVTLTLALTLLGLSLGCASNTAPSGWLSTAPEAAREAYGGWAEVATEDRSRADGELIAVDADSIYVLTADGLAVLAMNEVTSLKVTGYNPGTGKLRLWGLGGTIGTISHGWFLVLSAPIWIITSSVAAGVHSHLPQVTRPGAALNQLRQYARFPQGIPERLDRGALRPKP